MIFDGNKLARLWAVEDDMHMNVALKSTVFPTRLTVRPSGFGAQLYTGRVHEEIWLSERGMEMNSF